MVVYVPLITLVSAHNPYQTVVFTAGLAGLALLAIVAGVAMLLGTPAKPDTGAGTFT